MQTQEESSPAMVSPFKDLPCRVSVAEIVASRYGRSGIGASGIGIGGVLERPADWDLRKSGTDIVRLTDGSELRLASSAQQSPPEPGWVLLLFAGDAEKGFEWTLYGIQPS